MPADAQSPGVAVFCRTFVPPSQTFVLDAVTRLSRYRATVFCGNREGETVGAFERVHVGGAGYRDLLLSAAFVRAFRANRFAVVHAQFGPQAVYALPYCRMFNLPLVVSFHGYDVALLGNARRFRGPARHYAWLGHAALSHMSVGLCASTELRDMLVGQGVGQQRLRVHRLGIDTARFQPQPRGTRQEPPQVLMVGRLLEKKGFSYGLRAFAHAARSVPATLTIIGEGPLGGELRALAEALGIAHRVNFAGALAHAEVARIMADAAVLLAPSVVAADGDRDSGLIVLREAAACGVVPVASDMGGLPDSIDEGQGGFLVAERDVAAMADRLGLLLADPALRARMAEAARDKMVREFDHSVAMPKLEQAYDDARAAGPGQPAAG